MRETVQKAIDERLNDLRNPKSLLSLNKMESDTNKGYNGRQILEMFQNCEDEGATKVSIFLDTASCTLQISNDGDKAFSIEGKTKTFSFDPEIPFFDTTAYLRFGRTPIESNVFLPTRSH